MVTSEERRSKTVANESIHLLASTGIDCGDELEKEDEHEVDGKSSGDTELSCRSDENGDGHRKRKRSPYRMGTDPSQAFVSSPAPTSEGTSSVQYEKSSTAAASTDVAAHPPSKLKSLPQHSAGSGASTTTNTMTTTKTPAVNSMKKLNHRLFATSKKDRASSSPEQIVRKLPLGNRRRTTHPDDEDGGGGENNDSDDNNRDEPDLIYRGSIAHKVLEKVSNVDPTLLVDPDYLPTTSRNEHVFLDHNGTPVGGQLKRGKAKVEDEQRYGGQKHLNKDTNRGAAVLPTMISRIERKRSKQQEALRFSVEMPEVIFHPEVAQQKRRYRKGDLVTIKKQSHIIMVGHIIDVVANARYMVKSVDGCSLITVHERQLSHADCKESSQPRRKKPRTMERARTLFMTCLDEEFANLEPKEESPFKHLLPHIDFRTMAQSIARETFREKGL